MAGAKESLWTRSGISPVLGDPLAWANCWLVPWLEVL